MEFNLGRVNDKREWLGLNKIVLSRTAYKEPKIVNDRLVDDNGNPIGTKGDMYHKLILNRILQEGCMDNYPRPKYHDEYENAKYDEKNRVVTTQEGEEVHLNPKDEVKIHEDKVEILVPAHTLSINDRVECFYDLTKGETPMTTLRPIATKSSVAEILWIYQKQSNDYVEFDKLLGVDTWDKDHKIHNWWLQWAIVDEQGNYILNEQGHLNGGSCYGGTVGPRNLTDTEVIENLIDDHKRDGRRIMISLWQVDDFKKPHALKPCAFCTIWNVRRGWDGINYLDMTLLQRSSDFCTAGCINQVQYVAFQKMIADHTGLIPGYFTWKPVNVQIYDRHIEQSMILLDRDPFTCAAEVSLKEHLAWEDQTPDNVYIRDIPREEIKVKNKQLKFPIGV
jgi:thymidylate synthase